MTAELDEYAPGADDEPPAVAPPSPAPASAEPPPPRWRVVARYVERVLAIAGAFFIVYHLCFDVSEVVSPSMSPTLRGDVAGSPDNDWILFETVSGGPPPRHHLVVFQAEDGMRIAKRVMAFPGETVRIDDGECYVDGEVHPLPPEAEGVHYVPGGHLRPTPEGNLSYTVPEDSVFVLGDDSTDSWDSRYFGALTRDRWRGRVVGVIWPPSRWQWLY